MDVGSAEIELLGDFTKQFSRDARSTNLFDQLRRYLAPAPPVMVVAVSDASFLIAVTQIVELRTQKQVTDARTRRYVALVQNLQLVRITTRSIRNASAIDQPSRAVREADQKSSIFARPIEQAVAFSIYGTEPKPMTVGINLTNQPLEGPLLRLRHQSILVQ
jgi:hypothetical protein